MQSLFASGEFGSANGSEKENPEEMPAIREEFSPNENPEDFDELGNSGGIQYREDHNENESFNEVSLDETNTSLVDLNQSQPDQSFDQTGADYGQDTEGDGLNESGFFDEIDLNAIPDLTDTSNTVKQPTMPAAPSMITVAKTTFKQPIPMPAPPAIKTAFVPIPPPTLPKMAPVPVPLPVPVSIPGMPSGMNVNPTQGNFTTFTPVAPVPAVTVSHPMSTQKTSFVPNVFNSAVTGSSTRNLPSIGDG